MRKVIVYELLSLDGVAEAPDTFFGWDDSLDPNLAAVIGSQDAVILGRRTFDEWSREDKEAGFLDFWDQTPVIPWKR